MPTNTDGFSFGIRLPDTDRSRAFWVPGRRIASPSRTYGPYIDRLEDPDFALQKDAKAYDRMWRDCQIRSCLRLRQLATASRKIEFLPREDSIMGKAAAEFATRKWALVRRPQEVLLNILDAIPSGASINECVWKPDKKDFSWYTEEISPVHKDRFTFSLDGELCLITPEDPFYGETVPPRVFIHHRYDPEPAKFSDPGLEARLYFGQGEFDRIWPYYLYKQLVMRLGFTYLDRLAFPIPVGKYPFRSKEARAEVENIITKVHQRRGLAYPGDEGWDFDFIQTSNTGHNVSMEWVTYFDNQIAKVILGSVLLQEPGERGSFALGVNHSTTVFGTICEFDSGSLCDTLENSWCKWLFTMNGMSEALSPRVTQASGKTQDVSQVVDIMLLLADRGYPISVEQVSETTGIRPARIGETLLTMKMDGSYDMQHGDNSPFAGTKKPSDLPNKTEEATGRKRSSIPTGEALPYTLNIDILPEHSVLLEDIEHHAASGLYKPASAKRVSSKLGPLKAERIRRSASEARMIQFNYVNLKGERKEYYVEPYSYRYRRGFVYLYAFDPEDGRIKSFFAHKLTSIRKGKKFNPRWKVEIAA